MIHMDANWVLICAELHCMCFLQQVYIYILRTVTQLCFTLHFTLLGISFCLFVSQPVSFLVLETTNLEALVGLLKTFVVQR